MNKVNKYCGTILQETDPYIYIKYSRADSIMLTLLRFEIVMNMWQIHSRCCFAELLILKADNSVTI